MRKLLLVTLDDITCLENLLGAWQEFMPGKRGKPDVQAFGRALIDNLLDLQADLAQGTYRHGPYQHFRISDPKPRDIHKATVRDRLVHHAIYRVLYPYFSRTFIADSYSCQLGKGTHRALQRFHTFAYQVSRNTTRACWVLQCDIRKFFASIDQTVLRHQLRQHIPDARVQALLAEVIQSFHWAAGKGLPLGNLTSQLFVNVYMTPFDQFVKHELKVRHYLRYADDMAMLSTDRTWLAGLVPRISTYLGCHLKLQLHPQKVSIRTLASGIDFLGWVNFPHHCVLRTATKQRMFRHLKQNPSVQTAQSYLGMLGYGNAQRLGRQVQNAAWLWGEQDM